MAGTAVGSTAVESAAVGSPAAESPDDSGIPQPSDDAGIAAEEPPPLTDTFIAVRQSSLLDRLAADAADKGVGDDEAFRRFARVLGLLFRVEGRELLIGLRDDYHSFNPDLPAGAEEARDPGAYDRLARRLEKVLAQANFARITGDELANARVEAAEVDVQIVLPQDTYADVRFYARGQRNDTATKKMFFGLIKRVRPAIRLRHVIAMIRFADKLPERQRFFLFGRGRRSTQILPGKTVIKLFTDVAKADLDMLYPGARASMRIRDRLMLGVPAIAGGVPVLLNILPALSVLVIVAAAYLGLQATTDVNDDQLAQALAAMSALAGLVGFCMRQWVKFERQALKYQMALSDNLYFRNVCNNAAVFDYLLGTAEDQEAKETLLAYALLAADGPADRETLKARVEAWLESRCGATVDFDIDDAIAKLDRLELLNRTVNGELSVPPLDDALDRLSSRWDQVARRDPRRADAAEEVGAVEEAGMEAANEG